MPPNVASLETHQISPPASFHHATVADPIRRPVGIGFSDWLKSLKARPQLGRGQLNHRLGKGEICGLVKVTVPAVINRQTSVT